MGTLKVFEATVSSENPETVKPSTQRSRAYLRHQRRRVINRKRGIATAVGFVFKHNGELSKGKVHCGCGACVQKWSTFGPKHSDRKKLESQKEDLSNYTMVESELE